MRTLHQTLKLQPHHHTGRRLHHEHTSYRALVIVLVVAGVFMTGLGVASRAAAQSFSVSAWVNIPVPNMPPLVSAPTAGAVVTGSSVLVTGTCPLVSPQAVVSVSVDGTDSGTGACDSSNDFSVPVSISGGNHQIVATAVAIDGEKGLSSNPIAITSGATAVPPAISVSSDQPFMYAAGQDVIWTGTIGTAGTEYVHIDWGDNSQSNYTVQAGDQQFTHRYDSTASHNILLDVADTAGASSSLQFASAAYISYTPPAPVTTPLYTSKTVVGLYGLYITAISVMGIIWLEARHAAHHATAPVV